MIFRTLLDRFWRSTEQKQLIIKTRRCKRFSEDMKLTNFAFLRLSYAAGFDKTNFSSEIVEKT